MIRLGNVSKYYATPTGRHYVFRNVNFEFPDNTNIGILGRNGAGKSTLLRILGGADMPSEGRVIRKGRISWPMGLTSVISKSLTGVENARFACRIQGLRPSETAAKVEEIRAFAELGKFFDLPVSTYSSGMKGRLTFGITVAFDFETYLIDEITATGDVTFVEKARATFKQKRDKACFIKCTHSMQEVLSECDSGVLLEKGMFTFFPRVEDAVEAYLAIVAPDDEEAMARVLLKAEKRRKREAAAGSSGSVPEASKEFVAPATEQADSADLDARRGQRRAKRRKAREIHRSSGEADPGSRQSVGRREVGPAHLPAPMAPRLRSVRGRSS